MIVGLGKTGVSVAEHFLREQVPFVILDDAAVPPGLDNLRIANPGISVEQISIENLQIAEEIVLSPGVPLANKAVAAAVKQGIPITGDIQMFANLRQKPLAVVTGSNGKSTVVDLLGALLSRIGVKAGVGGNIGTPCLDLLAGELDCYVLEVSSYQLEVASSLAADVAVVLNLTPDHLNRYANEADYFNTKLKIYKGCRHAVINRAVNNKIELDSDTDRVTFGLDSPINDSDFGLISIDGEQFICQGSRALISVKQPGLQGRHNWLNVMAALAIGECLGYELESLIPGLHEYKGLRHRCELVLQKDDVKFINDSKATNPGATLAAIDGLGQAERNIVLLLGGDSKSASFSLLNDAIQQHVRQCFIYGRDREVIASQLNCPAILVETLQEVMSALAAILQAGDIVLLSPGCASLDQFSNFEQRGDVFSQLVREMF